MPYQDDVYALPQRPGPLRLSEARPCIGKLRDAKVRAALEALTKPA